MLAAQRCFWNQKLVLRNKDAMISLHCRLKTVTTNVKELHQKTFKEKVKTVWSGPNFKYWFVGGTLFVSWLTYYGLKNYHGKCINIDMLPLAPNHVIVRRKEELKSIAGILGSQNSVFDKQSIKKILIYGFPASGKTMLIQDYILSTKEMQNRKKIVLPKSNINVFLQCDSVNSFLLSLKAFAAKLDITLSDLEEHIGDLSNSFFALTDFQKCDVVLCVLQEAMKKHPGWVLVFDNIQTNTPKELIDMINQWFLKDGNKTDWSSGTLILLCDGNTEDVMKISDKHKYYLKNGMTLSDSFSLLKEVVNLDEATSVLEPIKLLGGMVNFNPLGLLCVGVLLREKLALQETMSICAAVQEIKDAIQINLASVREQNKHLEPFIQSKGGHELIILETVIAMAIKVLVQNNNYLRHGIDLIASLRPGTDVPQNVLSRHLKNPIYNLSPLQQSTGQVIERKPVTKLEEKVDEFQPKSKIWSNKRLAEYLKKIEDFFLIGINTIKDIYNLVYGELPALPVKGDGLDMFRSCELLLTGTLEPGGAKGVSMHSLVYNAARQQYLASTIYEMEWNHLAKSRLHYGRQNWYKKFTSFSEQACLQKYRVSFSNYKDLVNLNNQETGWYVDRYNAGVCISSVFRDTSLQHLKSISGYSLPIQEEEFWYLQSHLTKVLSAISTDMLVAKQDVAGRTTKEKNMLHIEYILQNQPVQKCNIEIYSEAIRSLSICYNGVLKNSQKAKYLLETLLDMEHTNTDSNLNIAKTLTTLGEVHQSLNEYEMAKCVLEEASEIYEKNRKKFGEYKQNLDYGKTLGNLGVVYGCLGNKQKSKETIERSLMFLQAAPPDLSDEAASKRYGADFATSLTNLGHSYVLLGMPLYGKKILDLALATHKNLHGDNHPEVVRTVTVLGIANLMMGNNENSKKLRYEAGKIQNAINSIPFY